MTVRVANDFKTEAQQELEKLVMENKALRDKLRSVEAQLEKLKSKSSESVCNSLDLNPLRTCLFYNLVFHLLYTFYLISNY